MGSVSPSVGIATCSQIISVFMFGLILIITISSSMCITVSTSSLMCHVCGCPGGGEEEGAKGPGQDKPVRYSDCSGQCDEPSSLGQPLPCPTGACQALTIQLGRLGMLPEHVTTRGNTLPSC
eukprot:TRINITY_DN18086_c0_g1_i1.p1 TRINITY_DN18086_c0_g1~~TRINITY_DN18086_c0_g1_i1.p1  ORF type:complete len:130 (-),score=27.77 TRINITY_DN18086_c0_g1_i1:86-451(-)